MVSHEIHPASGLLGPSIDFWTDEYTFKRLRWKGEVDDIYEGENFRIQFDLNFILILNHQL